jgi:hypothetical protein
MRGDYGIAGRKRQTREGVTGAGARHVVKRAAHQMLSKKVEL